MVGTCPGVLRQVGVVTFLSPVLRGVGGYLWRLGDRFASAACSRVHDALLHLRGVARSGPAPGGSVVHPPCLRDRYRSVPSGVAYPTGKASTCSGPAPGGCKGHPCSQVNRLAQAACSPGCGPSGITRGVACSSPALGGTVVQPPCLRIAIAACPRRLLAQPVKETTCSGPAPGGWEGHPSSQVNRFAPAACSPGCSPFRR